ncbi:MAG TPA: hypothetical protein VMF50_14180 [Candidatus Binataceae bacterium]|nr:hypothetical protein [Candidatus Binataceae bacterium]
METSDSFAHVPEHKGSARSHAFTQSINVHLERTRWPAVEQVARIIGRWKTAARVKAVNLNINASESFHLIGMVAQAQKAVTARHAHLYDRDSRMPECLRLDRGMVNAPSVPWALNCIDLESLQVVAETQPPDDVTEKTRTVWLWIGEQAE